MPQIRRNADRRRRVLYQSHTAPPTPSTPATRRAAEELREARQPAKEYGSRVHRRLRGRWFSLVPVSRLAMTIVATLLLIAPAGMAVLHHLAVTWPRLAYNESLARPLRIDRPDSFAAWWLSMVLVLASGAMLLIYQLRRHRRDDYVGHYRLWRLSLIVMLIASVHWTVDLVSWLGAWMDLALGDRAALSGANWLRLVLDVGGIILSMRLVAEVYRCRGALLAMVSAVACLGFSEAAHWRLLSIDSMFESTLVIAAPMMGFSLVLVAATIYLRLLYRQVRNISDGPTMRERVAQWAADRGRDEFDSQSLDSQTEDQSATESAPARRPEPPAPRPQPAAKRAAPQDDEDEEIDDAVADDEPKLKKPGLFSRLLPRRSKPLPADDDESSESTQSSSVSSRPPATDPEPDQDDAPEKPSRRWFGLRAAKPPTDVDASDAEDESSTDPPAAESAAEPVAKKKRRFSLRLKPQPTETAPQESDDQADETSVNDDSSDDESGSKKKGWFGGLFSRKKSVDDSQEDDDAAEDSADKSSSAAVRQNGGTRSGGPLSAASRSQRPATPQSQSNGDSADDPDQIDPDDIDWESMNKSERRRMRKQLKRSGQAA
ncbi:hypothetical protein NHH03_23225 [Stieleria sp. TO1_6]|uniref:hypothetical protein n=1 Tax=Stieleria tagensis TaxID=2956795 RepID=UPI00209B46C9|nr:hypothetical protein [Stieleria tagensis]MCO8124670.1 hypothetical protein [Stieleria tagensis]